MVHTLHFFTVEREEKREKKKFLSMITRVPGDHP